MFSIFLIYYTWEILKEVLKHLGKGVVLCRFCYVVGMTHPTDILIFNPLSHQWQVYMALPFELKIF